MGNKIVSFTANTASDSDQMLEVYRDFSMVSERRPTFDFKSIDGKPQRVNVTRFFATKDVNVKAVFNSLRNIFTWIPGERILNPEFGSKLRLYLYEGITPENKE